MIIRYLNITLAGFGDLGFTLLYALRARSSFHVPRSALGASAFYALCARCAFHVPRSSSGRAPFTRCALISNTTFCPCLFILLIIPHMEHGFPKGIINCTHPYRECGTLSHGMCLANMPENCTRPNGERGTRNAFSQNLTINYILCNLKKNT